MARLKTGLLTLVVLGLSFFTRAENHAEHKGKPSIIALAPHIVEMLYDVGAGEQIIGTTAHADYPAEAEHIPRIGNYVRLQIERVIELQPDLIIAWTSGNPSDDLARLKQLGFNIIYSQPNTYADIAKEMRYFGEMAGHKEKGAQAANNFLADLAKLEAIYKDKEAVSVFYELWSRPLTTIAKGSWPQEHLNICQASNAFEQAKTPYPQVNIEKVLLAPIELIIQPLSENQKDREGFNWQDWPAITAVKNNNIIQPDADALHRMTKRSLVELRKLCEDIDRVRQKLHPE